MVTTGMGQKPSAGKKMVTAVQRQESRMGKKPDLP